MSRHGKATRAGVRANQYTIRLQVPLTKGELERLARAGLRLGIRARSSVASMLIVRGLEEHERDPRAFPGIARKNELGDADAPPCEACGGRGVAPCTP